MSTVESEVEFRMFRDTLAELDRLVDVRGKLLDIDHNTKTIGEAIIHTLNLLTKFDVNVSEGSVIEELEHLVTVKEKTMVQTETCCIGFSKRQAVEYTLDYGRVFDELIESKIGAIQSGSFTRPKSKHDIEPMSALERLTEIQTKLQLRPIVGLLESKILEIAWRPRPTVSPRYELVVRR